MFVLKLILSILMLGISSTFAYFFINKLVSYKLFKIQSISPIILTIFIIFPNVILALISSDYNIIITNGLGEIIFNYFLIMYTFVIIYIDIVRKYDIANNYLILFIFELLYILLDEKYNFNKLATYFVLCFIVIFLLTTIIKESKFKQIKLDKFNLDKRMIFKILVLLILFILTLFFSSLSSVILLKTVIVSNKNTMILTLSTLTIIIGMYNYILCLMFRRIIKLSSLFKSIIISNIILLTICIYKSLNLTIFYIPLPFKIILPVILFGCINIIIRSFFGKKFTLKYTLTQLITIIIFYIYLI